MNTFETPASLRESRICTAPGKKDVVTTFTAGAWTEHGFSIPLGFI
jgi:hypothetical protein